MTTNRFLETVPLKLTPLTPIHIGCGMDFEPTNYVVDDGVLFHFDAARVALNPRERKELIDAANAGAMALPRIQRFFHERRERFAAAATLAVPMAAGLAAQHAARVGKIAQHEANGRDRFNLLEIERTAHHPHTGTPWIPGSSLKGAMRTAWLDQLNAGRSRPADERSGALEKRLLQGSFHTDPFRTLMTVDAQGRDALSKVVFSTNHKKRQVLKDGAELTGKGPATRRECIVGGQYAAFATEVRLAGLPGDHAPDTVPKSRVSWARLAAACNRYYLARLRKELALLDERRFSDPAWLQSLNQLLSAMAPGLAEGHSLLLRLGRHSGAESVTLDGVRDIRIMQGRGMPARFADAATTLWLAAEHENAPPGGLLPFGWLVAERADAQGSQALREWCAKQPKPDLARVRDRLAQAKAAALEAARQAEREAAERAAESARREEAARIAAEADARRSPNEREVHLLAQALAEKAASLRGAKERANTDLHARARRLAQRALGEDWSVEDRLALAVMLEAELPRVVNVDWKDERKKLKIAALKGAGG